MFIIPSLYVSVCNVVHSKLYSLNAYSFSTTTQGLKWQNNIIIGNRQQMDNDDEPKELTNILDPDQFTTGQIMNYCHEHKQSDQHFGSRSIHY